ncbi:MotA/TolQ/ExbB proton channel family protein [Aliiglaciecola sp. 3_MG-2023]|uniref:MotA/TolQ/ExbB proton channel family protein n=1 Tax=Aliiglaciecola sp. 3_MG-2023 TaxID=3062644 RepID=UPI0026E389DA|nr:MotA/TolQ/ExbB proton channel family protein [Aliiglaciecola sp. 3_MG-2023]MDO6694215.1 MotA/TolQ/ExbB proton channel family protein [Aliiglaciecola sp. 3_MG-2023]
MISQISHSWVCWAILLLAIYCYQELWQQYLFSRSNGRSSNKAVADTRLDKNDNGSTQNNLSSEFTAVLIGALPLMGLLGTIMGLLECFAGIASDGASSTLLSDGIGKALLTTQLGLVCAIPAWILQGNVRNRIARQQAYVSVRSE